MEIMDIVPSSTGDFKRVTLIRNIKSFKVLYEQAPPERGTFFKFLVFRGVGISQVKVHEKEGSDLGIQKGLVFNIAFELITVLPSRPV